MVGFSECCVASKLGYGDKVFGHSAVKKRSIDHKKNLRPMSGNGESELFGLFE